MTQITNENNTIMIVDDSRLNLSVLSRMLMDRRYNVHTALSGARALETIQKTLPDLILLDIIMPGMDGYEVCQRLKSDKNTRDIPVIFISALDETLDKVKAFEIGGVDYIPKPFQVEEVLMRVKTHLALRNMQKSLQEKNAQLEEALANIKMLSGLLPICAYCKKIRDDQGYWNKLEEYIERHSDVLFTHGLCPGCRREVFGEHKKKSNDPIRKT